MSTESFSIIYNGPFRRYLLLSKSIGQDVQIQSEIVDSAFQAEMRYLEFSESNTKPVLENVILEPITTHTNKTKHYVCMDPIMSDHINVIAQSIKALLWMKRKDPVSFLEEVIADARACTNILLVFFKDKDYHVEWVDAWVNTLNELSNFVRRRYPKGLLWKESQYLSSSGDISESAKEDLEEQLTESQILHQILRQVSESLDQPKQNTSKVKPAEAEVFVKKGNKWRIEHKKHSKKHLTIDRAEKNNVVYVYDCANLTVVVENKINVIKLDSCEKVCVIFRSLISGVEIIGCKDMKLHAFGTLPSVNVEASNDVNIHLTRRGLDVQVLTSQSSKVSLSYPLDDGYYKTFFIPTRLMTTINSDQSLKTLPLSDN